MNFYFIILYSYFEFKQIKLFKKMFQKRDAKYLYMKWINDFLKVQ